MYWLHWWFLNYEHLFFCPQHQPRGLKHGVTVSCRQCRCRIMSTSTPACPVSFSPTSILTTTHWFCLLHTCLQVHVKLFHCCKVSTLSLKFDSSSLASVTVVPENGSVGHLSFDWNKKSLTRLRQVLHMTEEVATWLRQVLHMTGGCHITEKCYTWLRRMPNNWDKCYTWQEGATHDWRWWYIWLRELPHMTGASVTHDRG